MTLYGCETDPTCNSGGGGGGGGGLPTDPNPTAPGYWMGTTVTPATCISPSGAGISDVDADGTNDYCENLLADKFRPALRFSQYDCDTGMEPYWAAKAFPAEGNVMRVAYLFSYYEDCGLPNPTPHDAEDGIITGGDLCGVGQVAGTLLTFNGLFPDYSLLGLPISPDDQCAGHAGDSEFLILDLRYDPTSTHWYVSRALFSAHWPSSSTMDVTTGAMEYPDKYAGYPRVWVGVGKHSNYPTRYACNTGGTLGSDSCSSNPNVDVQIRSGQFYNVGSMYANMINQGTCVTGGLLVQTYPTLYGTECYWVPGRYFLGWNLYGWGTPPTPYYTILIATFECYSYTYTLSGTTLKASCTDWGMHDTGQLP